MQKLKRKYECVPVTGEPLLAKVEIPIYIAITYELLVDKRSVLHTVAEEKLDCMFINSSVNKSDVSIKVLFSLVTVDITKL